MGATLNAFVTVDRLLDVEFVGEAVDGGHGVLLDGGCSSGLAVLRSTLAAFVPGCKSIYAVSP